MAGNTINVQGSYIDVHDNENVYLNVDKAEVGLTPSPSPKGEGSEYLSHKDNVNENVSEVPESLRSEEAEELWERLREAGFIESESYALAKGVSANQAAYIAAGLADQLGIKKKWQVFERLWGVKNLAQLAGSWQQTGKLPPKSREIDRLMQ